MKVNIKNSDFSNISTAVFYKWHRFIPASGVFPSDLESLRISCTSDRVQYWGSKTYTGLRDFSEYDFGMFPDKVKFGDSLMISNLDAESRELLGKNLEDLEKVESYMFPSISATGEEADYDYFGSTLINNQTFILFDTPENYWKIELYEDIVESNNSRGGFVESEFLEVSGESGPEYPKPFMVITLGPEPDLLNNSESMYYYYDSMISERSRTIGAVSYVKLLQEVSLSKAVWMLLTSDNDITDINLSYKSWTDSINPNRNMCKYSLRNDEYWSTKDSSTVLEKIGGTEFWYDMNSKTLLGNEEIPADACPIMKMKKKYIDLDTYSDFVEYSLGDKVKYGHSLDGELQEWESLCDGNLGNNPVYSSKWVLSGAVVNTETNRVTIMMNPPNAGSTNPGGTITVKRNDSRRFLVLENVGYRLAKDESGNFKPPSYDSDSGSTLNPSSYSFSVVAEGGVERKYLNVYNWARSIETGKLIVNFEVSKSIITLSARDPEGLMPSNYSEWPSFFSEPEFRVSKSISEIDGIVIDPEITNGKMEFMPGQKVTLVFPELSKYTISKATSTYYVGNSETPTVVDLEVSTSEKKENLVSGQIDFTETTLTLQLAYKIFEVFMAEYIGFEISKVLDYVQYGEETEFSFYTKPGITFGKIIISEISGKQVTITLKDLGKTVNLGTTELSLSRDDDDIFTLNLKNPITDYKIQIYDTK